MARIRLMLVVEMTGLVLSGLTAFPLVRSTAWLLHWLARSQMAAVHSPLVLWVGRVHEALVATAQSAPFLAYGTDWLAFAHLVLAVVFVGPYRDPVRNRWVIDFGLIACAGVIPLALIAGPIRGIPVFWRLIDCSFGVVGALPLLLCRHYLALLEHTGRVEEQLRQRTRHRRRRRRTRLHAGS